MGSTNCRNCGNQLIQGARFCPRCGVATAEGPPSALGTTPAESYQTPQPNQQQDYFQQPYQPPPYQQQAAYQPPMYQQPSYQPGAPQPYFPQGQGVAPAMYYPEPKDKSVAVLLAVFLGCWTWVYTYKKDAWKFWLCLGLHLTVFNPIWTVFILLLPNIGLQFWSIIDAAAKDDQFYRNYPNS
jgi:hypothetical protein